MKELKVLPLIGLINYANNRRLKKNIRRIILKVTYTEFEEMYGIKKEYLLSKYPFTAEALREIMDWESNREFVENYDEKKGNRKY